MADIKHECNELRGEIKALDDKVQALKKHEFFGAETESKPTGYAKADKGEMQANLQLAHRHLEDARMRLGKTIQALEGGVSIYDQ